VSKGFEPHKGSTDELMLRMSSMSQVGKHLTFPDLALALALKAKHMQARMDKEQANIIMLTLCV
jgi:hypothetical protein